MLSPLRACSSYLASSGSVYFMNSQVVASCPFRWHPTAKLTQSQPPPATLHYHSTSPLPLLYSAEPLPPYSIAYETWGTLNSTSSNAILLHTGLSASSHVASRGNDVSSSTSYKAGWWEDFVGPGKSIDTDKFFVICTNVLGGCFGSTGPSSPYPLGEGGVRWATRFPLLSIHDMTRAQLGLLDDLGIQKLYASVGSSMGGMQSLSLAYLAPERVGRVASISATGRSGLGGVGMRYAQRSGQFHSSREDPVSGWPRMRTDDIQCLWRTRIGIEGSTTTESPHTTG